ncbi:MULTISPECIES: AGE family epimerase/isomerase [Bacteroides]|jgi:N-acylglucosamine 2-epimerase|uniref:AGE family epimerase/isomerase n=1 Tax=Bacteroides TaxID=816 RepID=UPI000E44937C|nr:MULTISPECIES: AGE family epimerase/isomerase [Bacteroides]MBS7574086.1 AGE family epimerase/isomerase [Bacteroides propionicigenes]RGM27001.1 N-acylglucosamine 2-epimerase [Bacteroides sp. OM08-17BH]HBO06548.1 N-acylglucosamine 2-epimerase [Bacteroides sp.]
MNVTDYLNSWSASYRQDFTENIMPFWMKHGLDHKHGGVYTCIDRDGTLMDTTKSVWFQGRFGFIAAYAYNNMEKNPEWLAASKSCIDFIEKYCFDTDGHMYFEITDDGKPLRKRRYVFSECFAAIAMAEYAIASGDGSYAEKALSLFKNIQRFLSTPGFLEPKYLPTLQARGHSITMILINTASRIRAAISDPILDTQINDSLAALRKYFIHPEFKALLETVGKDGEFIDTCNGRVINPGHCIETSWFILEEARFRNWDKELVQMALQILDWSWEWGWDKEYGGIINFRDCRHFPAQDYSQDMKFWWPQTEAIIATLYAYQATHDEKYLAMHRQISDWTYAHFPDKEYGEWYGYLHRDGTIAQPAKGNLFKGPFHIPRMMIRSYMLCKELL